MKRDPIQPMDDGLMLGLYRHMDAALSAPAIFVADPLAGYRIRHVSASCRLLGVRSDMSLPECVPPLTPSKLDQLWSEIGKSGTASVETEFQSAAGRRIAIEVVFSLLEHDGRCLMAGHARDIAERKQQATPIRDRLEQEQRFSRMAEHLPGFVYTFRKAPDGRASFPYTSSGIEDIYGLQPEDVAEDVAVMVAVMHPDYLPMVLAGIEQSITTRTPYSMEFRVCHPRKGVRWAESKARPDLEPDGSILFHGMMLDITQRKRTESVLSFIAQRGWKDGKESFLTALARHLGDVLGVDYVIVDKIGDDPGIAETVALYAQGAVLPNMQYSLKGTPCENVMEGSLCCYPSGVQAAFPEDALLVDMQVDSYAGHALWDSTGKVIGLIAVLDGKPMQDVALVESMLRMVSTRVAAELEHELAEKALAESRMQLGRIIDTIPDPVFVKDRQHRWIHLNQAFCEFIGHPLEALLGKSDYDFCQAGEADVFWAKDEAVFESGEVNINEEVCTDREGTLHTIVTKKARFEDSAGNLFLVGSIRDITERKRTQRELMLLNHAVNMSNDAIHMADGQGRIVYANDGMCRALGYGREELLNLTIPDIDPAVTMERIVEWVNGDYSGRTFSAVHRDKHGREFPVEISTAMFEYEEERFCLAVARDISERKAAQQRLELLEHAIDLSSDAIYLIDEALRFTYVNDAACRALGYSREDLLGLGPLDIDADIDPDTARHLMRTVPLNTRVSFETRHRARDGRTFPVELNATHFERDGAKFSICVVRDISERKRLESAMVAREREFRSLAENLPDNIARWDIEGRILVSNPTHQRTLGKPAGELIGKTHIEAFPDDRYRPVDTAIAQVVASGEPVVFVRQLAPAENGEMRIHDIKLVPEFDDAGQVASVLGIGRDMTDIYRMQEAVAAREQEFRSLAENLPDNIGRWDIAGRYIYINPTYERTLGTQAASVIGKTIAEAFPARRESPAAMAVARVIATGEAVPFVRQPVPAENGEMRIHEVNLVPERDIDGNVVGVLGIGRDMTDIYRMQEAVATREQEFRSLAENSPNSIIRYDREGRIRYLNAGLARELGVSEADLIGKLPSEVWPDGRFDDIQRAAAQAVATETEVSIEICDPVAEGEGKFHQIRIVPEQDIAGQVIGTIAFGWDITGLKRYAQSLQERVKLEGQLSGLAASVPGFIFTVRLAADRHISFPFASAGIEDLVGFRPEDIRDDVAVLHTRYHPEDLPRVYAGMEASEQTLSPFRIEIRVFHPERGMRWVEIRSTPQRYEDGSTEWHGIMLDITERKAVEKQLTLLHSSLDHVNDTVLLVSEDAGILYVNQGACHVLGYPREQLLGMRVADIDPDYQLDIWPEHWRDLKIHGALNFESRHRTSDGRVYPVDITANYVEFEGQGYNLAICRDITERKQAEMLVAEREREFRTLAENAPELIIRYDKECRRIYANPAYAKDMGVPRADVANKTPLQFWQPRNVSAEQYMAQLRRVMETGESSEVFLEWVSADGRLQYRCLSLVAEYDSDGEPCGALAIGHDIGASRKSEMLAKVRMSIFEQLTKGGDIREVLNCVADFVEVSSPGLLCSIMLVDAEGKHLRTVAAPSLPAFYSEAVDGIAIGEGVGCCGTAAWRGEAVLAEDIARHPCWTDARALAAQAGLAACWSFPLQGADGMLGTFAVYRRVTGLPTEEDMVLIREASHLAVISIERKQREEKLMRQASYDTLTGLPNRRLFSNRLKEEVTRAERAGHNVGLLFIDLDRFKEVNDNLGHDFGDSLLIEASNRIRHCVRESDSVARLGGDEFVVILPEIEEITHLGRVAQDLLDVMAQAFVLGGHSAYVSASIGIACYPADADNMDSLMGCADQAMYAAKQLGRNGFSFFTAAMQQQAQQRMHLANDLRDAVAYGQLQVYYQPIVDIGSRRVVKAEALLRWRHPVRGMVPPDHFIPIAEEIGIIHEVGEWVFREAANTAKRWREMQGTTDSCPHTAACPPQVSVNMSPRQFMRGNVGSSWVEYLHAVGLPAEAMVIEITEGLLLGDQSDILEKLERFRAAGMRIALDDFGTGYSAMAYLKKFPIDYLKIDRSFVRDLETDPNDRAIAEAIVVMARKLGLKTIAEGVETESQRDLLAEVGCDYVQGYLYAKPMPVENFLAYTAAINR